MSEFKEIKAVVSGRVHGVFFREFVKKKAVSLSLTGTVENIKDGSVIVIAQGKKENINKLVEYLHEGSFNSQVSSVDVIFSDIKKQFSEFSILY